MGVGANKAQGKVRFTLACDTSCPVQIFANLRFDVGVEIGPAKMDGLVLDHLQCRGHRVVMDLQGRTIGGGREWHGMERLKRVSDRDQVIGQNGGAPFDRVNDQGAARQSRTRREDIQAARAVATFGPALKCCLLITECLFGRQSPLVHARYSQYEACFPDAPVIVGHAFGREDGQFVSGDAGRNAGSVEKPGNLLAIWELGHGRALAVCFVFAQSGQ